MPGTIPGMDGDQIRQARERKGWNQPQLAKAVGVGPRTVGNWENGRTVPKNKMAKLEEVLAPNGGDDPIVQASDERLLTELLRRATQRRDSL